MVPYRCKIDSLPDLECIIHLKSIGFFDSALSSLKYHDSQINHPMILITYVHLRLWKGPSIYKPDTSPYFKVGVNTPEACIFLRPLTTHMDEYKLETGLHYQQLGNDVPPDAHRTGISRLWQSTNCA